MPPGRKLRLRWVVFMDEFQNLVLFDPELERRVGVYDRPERVPSVVLALTEGEITLCLEAVTDRLARAAQSTEGRERIIAARKTLKDARERAESLREEQH